MKNENVKSAKCTPWRYKNRFVSMPAHPCTANSGQEVSGKKKDFRRKRFLFALLFVVLSLVCSAIIVASGSYLWDRLLQTYSSQTDFCRLF